nr:hypothetical protein HJG63_006581 [Rousettus aegyptiacus]
MYTEIGNYEKAEDTYQKVFSMKTLDKDILQDIYFHYGQFQEFQRKSESDAIIYYLKAINIENQSYSRDKSISSLEKLVLRKLRRNASDIESLRILRFIDKLKGEINEASESDERALKLAADFESSVGLK